jgi:mannitol operon transcriptional antiterminator
MEVPLDYSQRAIEIVNILIEHQNHIAVAEIAKALQISKRTVFREMEMVESIVEAFGMTLEKKPRIGIAITATEVQIQAFNHEMEKHTEIHFDQEMRQRMLIIELLKSKEPRKFYYFSNMLNVSEATISNDMDKIEPWFEERDIRLIRKPGYGVFLEANETKLRKAIIDFLYQHYEHNELITLLETEVNQGSMLTSLIDKTTLIKVTEILKAYETYIAHRLTDAAYMGLLIHLAIAVQRTQRGEKITMNQDLLEDLKTDAHYEMAATIGKSIERIFNIGFPEDELGFITMHLKGSKLKSSALLDENDVMMSNFKLSRLASKMMKVFHQESGFNIRQDEKLLVGLVSHLRPAITRMHLSLAIRNPLLDKIKEMYPDIFRYSKKTAQCITEAYDLLVPEEEVGYLAMHFGAAIERIENTRREERHISVGVVCSSGIGTSSLLSSRLTKLFPKLTLVGQFSKEDVIKKRINTYPVELLISTISLSECDLPSVKVNPLLLDEDIEKIKHMITLIKMDVKNTEGTHPSYQDTALIHIERIHEMTENVLALTSQFDLVEMVSCPDLNQLIKRISQQFSADFRERRKLQKLFLKREKLGSTMIHGEGIILLHTKATFFETVVFSIWRLSSPLVMTSGEKVHIAVVMGIPEVPSPIQTAMMSHLSKAIIEDDMFLKHIKASDEETIEGYINQIFNKWLKTELIKGGFNDL